MGDGLKRANKAKGAARSNELAPETGLARARRGAGEARGKAKKSPKVGKAKKSPKAIPVPAALVVMRREFEVDGGAVLDGIVSSIELSDGTEEGEGRSSQQGEGEGEGRSPEQGASGAQPEPPRESLGATLYLPRSELGYYPIGAKVRVTVERLG